MRPLLLADAHGQIDSMHVLRAITIALLIVGFTPGVAELLVDGAHMLLEGHSAHATSHDNHQGPGTEHGCTGWHHTCPCHSSVSFVASAEPLMPVTALSAASWWMGALDWGPEGVSLSVERPPRV